MKYLKLYRALRPILPRRNYWLATIRKADNAIIGIQRGFDVPAFPFTDIMPQYPKDAPKFNIPIKAGDYDAIELGRLCDKKTGEPLWHIVNGKIARRYSPR